jgi:hypothetical protein
MNTIFNAVGTAMTIEQKGGVYTLLNPSDENIRSTVESSGALYPTRGGSMPMLTFRSKESSETLTLGRLGIIHSLGMSKPLENEMSKINLVFEPEHLESIYAELATKPSISILDEADSEVYIVTKNPITNSLVFTQIIVDLYVTSIEN